MKTGVVRLPLHSGKAPKWLFEKMKVLAREITFIIVKEYGTEDFLKRISDPYWFQAFGCVLGFDWHSSGITTTVCGALKGGLKDISKEIDLFVCGGKGSVSRKTPQEISEIGLKGLIRVSPQDLIYASRMSAKVDSTALQDGYQLYHHSFFFNSEGKWAVIQQGMNLDTLWARRYHWLGKDLSSFVCEPHKAICCDHTGKILNMVAEESRDCRKITTELAGQPPPKVIGEFERLKELNLPKNHFVSFGDIRRENLKKILEKTYMANPGDFESLLAIEGVGPKTIRALALISELIYKRPFSIKDPVRFSFAHGGKDGTPYPVNRKEYDLSIQILRETTERAKIGRSEKLSALKRLANF